MQKFASAGLSASIAAICVFASGLAPVFAASTVRTDVKLNVPAGAERNVQRPSALPPGVKGLAAEHAAEVQPMTELRNSPDTRTMRVQTK